ncbi:DNA topoisomerase (ATP-hydrolyzing) subunit A [Spirochaeta lutea]|uniref:DNA topoisomerase (ATP-hydrolyzing) subunit A n=1 Tax=Spirochaeta lutea TaxID=1480694 RepID=UPI00068B3611|nr:DNA topoisomerase (ATP-hydrolyzing) subunit A [Spirochaeta lutea]
MIENRGRVIPIAIEDEVKTSYLNYAMSVIISRALPDVRDGLKPVHRRILHGMNEMGLRSDKAPKKSARIVGDVLGKFHPHGDQSVYDALVRLAQEFSMRYPLVNGQGNYGSVDGDPPAAMRYTEARMHKLAEEMLRDIKKETVDFVPNYDDSMEEPSVLPAALPYLLVNGASGIAVGMATNIPPHNLNEVAAAIGAYIDNPEITIDGLMKFISGPDFPTGGTIFGRKGIRDAYTKGRGKITVRSKFSIESTNSGKDVIIFHEIPYQVNKANLMIRIADLVRDKIIDGISDMRDESDRDGLRVVIELKRGASPKIVLNHLFTHTQLQVNFNVNSLALVNGKPEVLNLKDMIVHFVSHRRDVIIRRTKYDLRKAEERAHILEGLKIALENIDEVIKIIKESENVDTARTRLMNRFGLSEIQAQAILDMRLQKLTSLETKKILEELREILALIQKLKDLLASEQKILGVVKEETVELAGKFGDPRRTDIIRDEVEEINIEDLIQKEDMVVLISHRGYIKRVPFSAYRVQGRGGRGSSSATLRDDDFIQQLFIANTHDYIMIISSEGKAYWLKVHEIPEGSRTSKGQHIRALLQINVNEEVAAVVSLKDFLEDEFIFFATSRGMVKRVKTSEFRNAKTRGIVAMTLHGDDKIVSAIHTTGEQDITLVSRLGKGLRMAPSEVRVMGRTAQGVGGMKLASADELASAIEVDDETKIIFVTENGWGKRMLAGELSPHGRNTSGQRVYNCSDLTGEVVGAMKVGDDDLVIAMTSQGTTIKMISDTISLLGRNTRGVRIVSLVKPDFVVGIDTATREDEEAEDEDIQDPRTLENPEDPEEETLPEEDEEDLDNPQDE